MDLKTVFTRLGFRKNAYLIYQALISSTEPLLIAHIASISGIERPEVYRNIDALLEKNFIEKVTIGKRRYYIAKDSCHIERAFKHADRDVRKLSESLISGDNKELSQHVRYFKGRDTVRAIFDDVIDHMPRRGTFYRYTSEKNLSEVNKLLSINYRERRDKKKLERLVISNPLSGKQKRSRLERFIKYISPETNAFDQNIIQLVYGDRLAFINLNTNEGYIIEDKLLSDFQTVIFNQLYKKL